MIVLPFSKNNPIKVTLKSGEVVLARITRYNEATGMLNWIDKNEKWQGKSHVSNVVKATPEEIVAWSKAKEATTAPVHAIMAKWSLGKTKRGPEMMEGHYYEVPVLLNGKKVGLIVDEGNGGMNITRFKDHNLSINFDNDCREWAKANGDTSDSEHATEFWGWWDEARPNGKDAATYFKEKEAQLAMWMAGK